MNRAEIAAALTSAVTRSLIALLLTVSFCYGFLNQLVDAGGFGQMVSMVIAFWFGQRAGMAMTSTTTTTAKGDVGGISVSATSTPSNGGKA